MNSEFLRPFAVVTSASVPGVLPLAVSRLRYAKNDLHLKEMKSKEDKNS